MTIIKILLMIILFTMYWSGSYDDADHHQTRILIIIIQWRRPWSAGPNDDHHQSFHDHSITHWSSSQSDADNSSYIISRTREDMLDPDDHPSMLIIIQDPLDPGRRGAAEGAAANTGNLLQKILIVAISLVIIIIIVDHHSYPIVVAKTRNHHHHCCIIIIHTSALFQRHGGEILNWEFEGNLFIEPVQRFLIVNIFNVWLTVSFSQFWMFLVCIGPKNVHQGSLKKMSSLEINYECWNYEFQNHHRTMMVGGSQCNDD